MQKNNDMAQIVNEIAEEINSVLNNRNRERYFQEIVLLYSFIENLLKWLVFVKILWEKTAEGPIVKPLNKVRFSCGRLTFNNALNMAYSIGLIDFALYEKLDSIRQERNDVVHQFWVYAHRDDLRVLRKKLEKLAQVSNQLVTISNQLVEEIGVEEVYEMFL